MTIDEAAKVVVRRLITQAVAEADQPDAAGPTTTSVADALRCRVMQFSEQAGPWFAQVDEWPELEAEVVRMGGEVADLIERALAETDDEEAA